MSKFTTDTEAHSKSDRAQSATEKLLTDLTGIYSKSNRSIPVKLGRRSYIATDGSFISINDWFGTDDITGPQTFRFQTDTTAHETWHDNESDLESKKKFSEKHDVAPYTAGVVINIVEDHYIDYLRTQENPGQKKALAHKLQVHMHEADNSKFDPIDKQDNKGKALVNGLLQVSSLGFPIFDDKDAVEDEVLDFLTWARARIKDVREMTPKAAKKAASTKISDEEAMARAQDARRDLSEEIFNVLVGHLDDPSDADDYVKNSQPFPIPHEIPDDMEIRPMTDEEKEKFDKMKTDMPTIPISMPSDGDESESGDDSDVDAGDSQGSGDGQSQSAGGSESGDSDEGEQGSASSSSQSSGDQQAGDEQAGGSSGSDDAGDDTNSAGDSDDSGENGDEAPDGDDSGAGGGTDDDGDAGSEESGAEGGENGDDGDTSGDGGDGDDDRVCGDCGTELVQVPREEADNGQGLLDTTIRTDGGMDMVYVCPDCGQQVDPETGEHQGAEDDQQAGDDGDQGDTGAGADGDDTDADSESENGDGSENGTEQDGEEDEAGDADGADGDSNGESDGESAGDGDESEDGADGDSGEQDGADGDQQGDSENEGESGDSDSDGNDTDDGGAPPDPFSENDNTEYTNERHDVHQIGADELARERDDMLSLAKNQNVAGNYGVDGQDVSEVEQRFVRQYQKIKLAKNADEDSMYVRQMARDERSQKKLASTPSEDIRQAVMEGPLKDEIEEAFRELKTRNHYVEAKVGEDLNMDGVIANRSVGTEIRHNYKHMQRAEKGDRAIGVGLDMSGSVNEAKVKRAIGALYAGTGIIGDSFVASAFLTDTRSNIHTPLITGPDEEFQWTHLDGITTSNRTPTASGVLDVTDLLQQSARPEKVMVVITDGKPNVAPDGSKGGDTALDTAASAVMQARHQGIKVIGLGVGSSINESNLQTMFGHDGYLRTDMDNLAETLLKIYKRQMSLVQEGAV